ncbi:hypothetical protein PR202_ga01966 [Eleusine coracana subsp. coracana]|uniref:Nuclear cap-binding protein subunit 2 n=1 Tax=Eleusine coracana subsp. coracana TaxID=191504 RepID=A0AAV5BJN3_ELECO|nr:hypothetical protein PR202_ga01279 [Eleusine coracana subsp. coracana]GJM86137.1 hypothetical protein PR202_ga01966 [Eleusine coracana subsp. coracana]
MASLFKVWICRNPNPNQASCFPLRYAHAARGTFHFQDPNKLSAYRDRRFPGTQEEYEATLQASTTVYIGNMSFYTTEEQAYELFSRAGEIKKIIMGLDKNSKTPCGFCFVLKRARLRCSESRYTAITQGRMLKIQSNILVEQCLMIVQSVLTLIGALKKAGNGVVDGVVDKSEMNTVQITILISFHNERNERKRGYGDSYRNDRGGDYQRKRHRNDDRSGPEASRRAPDSDSAEKNPRFREKGDSDEEDDDYDKRRRR